MCIRIIPVIFYGIVLTLIATLGTVGMISSVVGFKALKSSFKMISLFSFGNLTIGQIIMIMMLSEIIGIFALSSRILRFDRSCSYSIVLINQLLMTSYSYTFF